MGASDVEAVRSFAMDYLKISCIFWGLGWFLFFLADSAALGTIIFFGGLAGLWLLARALYPDNKFTKPNNQPTIEK